MKSDGPIEFTNCQYCGDDNSCLCQSDIGKAWWIMCRTCKSCGPVAMTIAEACDAWNIPDDKIEAVRSVVEKHRRAVAEPYLIPGGSKTVAREFFEDIERVIADRFHDSISKL